MAADRVPAARDPPAAPDRGPSAATLAGLALAAVYLIWGSSYLATKVLVTAEPPLLAAGLRFTLAGLLLGAFAWWRHGPPRLDRAEGRHVVLVALGSIVVSNGCNVLGLQHVASNVAALLNATPALIIAWLGTFGERASPLSGTARAGLLLGLVGVALILAPRGGAAPGGLAWPGVILLGCLGWSLATIYFRNARITSPPTMFLSLQMLAGGLVLLCLAWLAGEPFVMTWSTPGTAAFLWLTVMSSCVAYSAFGYLARNTTPVVVGTYAYVNPAVAALLGWLVLDEVLATVQLAGMLVILVAIGLVTGFAGRWVRLPRTRR
jgi:drug/metabolite transporter (DMT)-like permease